MICICKYHTSDTCQCWSSPWEPLPADRAREEGVRKVKKMKFSSFFYPCQTSQTWGRFGMRGIPEAPAAPEGCAAITECSETIQRHLCAHMQAGPAPTHPFLVSSCCSQTWQSNFSGFYAAALCTMLLFPIKLYFLTGLTLLLLGDVGPSSTGGGGSWVPLQGPILPLHVPMGPMTNPWNDSWQQSQKVLYLL